MLFGEGTDARTAHRLLDAALDAGVSFFDTAEMYPVPQRAATQGASERILGDWLRRTDRYAAIAHVCILPMHVVGPLC